MYLRNVKQILRQAEGGFDERRYGFGGLMDLLKALQRESAVRIERDRRGENRCRRAARCRDIRGRSDGAAGRQHPQCLGPYCFLCAAQRRPDLNLKPAHILDQDRFGA